MLNNLLARIFGSRNQRLLRRLAPVVAQVGTLEEKFRAMDDASLQAQTLRFRERLAQGETLDALMPEAFAVVREAGRRVLGMRHFDVQLIGGAVLHQGKISEMRTGEGKTLVATLPAYLNALTGKGVHVVTVNDYLARRDSEWMGRIHRFLGLTVGVVVPGQSPQEKREAYQADITYATNNELGFDYLRDNLAFSLDDKVQRGHAYAIVDEVDSILIDEARTPLIISGPTDDDPELWRKLNGLIPRLTSQKEEEGPGDFLIDEKTKQVHLSEAGHEQVENLLRGAGLLGEDESLYDPSRIVLFHHFAALLRAHHLYRRDVEYIVRNGQVIIIDEFTGRMMHGRRWSDGLHQAVEAKEGVQIQQENQTLASITFQNYFRLYGKLSGMTGTADTEAFEFQNIYNLEVVIIPTNQPMVRDDRGDLVFGKAQQKFDAVIKDILEANGRGQPILVGTASIETSELLSGLLRKQGIEHEVLNAKQHEREADIVAQAGRPGAVTIATNMAGRGTDIVLGGSLENELAKLETAGDGTDLPSEATREMARAEWKLRHEKVLAAGGLYVIGSERHESRRIDNQLRGRSGRQGDPGRTRFYLSLDDTLMRIFTPPRMRQFLLNMGLGDGEPLEHRMVSNAIETAQRKVEAQNFDMRKNLLEYDNVANDQRKAVYELRDELMTAADVSPLIDDIRGDVVQAVIDAHVVPQSLEENWNLEGLEEALLRDFNLRAAPRQWLKDDPQLDEPGLRARVLRELAEAYAAKKQREPAALTHAEKVITLQILDQYWREHLAAIDYLRQGIHLRGYAQKDPKQEYKREAFTMFNDMLARFKHAVISNLSRLQMLSEEEVAAMEAARRQQPQALSAQHAEARSALAAEAPEPAAAATPPQPARPPLSSQPSAPQGRPVSFAAPAAAAAGRADTFTREQPKVGRNDPCPCGSGKKYKQCHGRLS